jgi:hypothetical protein
MNDRSGPFLAAPISCAGLDARVSSAMTSQIELACWLFVAAGEQAQTLLAALNAPNHDVQKPTKLQTV